MGLICCLISEIDDHSNNHKKERKPMSKVRVLHKLNSIFPFNHELHDIFLLQEDMNTCLFFQWVSHRNNHVLCPSTLVNKLKILINILITYCATSLSADRSVVLTHPEEDQAYPVHLRATRKINGNFRLFWHATSTSTLSQLNPDTCLLVIDSSYIQKMCVKLASVSVSVSVWVIWRITNRHSVKYAELRIGILLKVCRFLIRHTMR